MGINKYNSEGYYDPTVYEALSNIEKEEKAARRVYRPLVYICSPYAGDVERTVNMARVYSRFARYVEFHIRHKAGAEQGHCPTVLCGKQP